MRRSKERIQTTRLPQIGVIGFFQTGKSLILNGILGGACLPVGNSGLRTTPCGIACSEGALDRVEITRAAAPTLNISPAQFLELHEHEKLGPHTTSIRVSLNRPILREMGLIDTPGFDFDQADDSTAEATLLSADAVLLVITQQFPAAIAAFDRMVRILKQRPWGMILNCGKSGPHMEDPEAPAARRVEACCIQQLAQVGVPAPVFSQRIDGRTLEPFARSDHRVPSEQGASRFDEASFEQTARALESLRSNLRQLAKKGIRHLLESAEMKFKKIASKCGERLEFMDWNVGASRFTAQIQRGSRRGQASGAFTLYQSEKQIFVRFDRIQCTKRGVATCFARALESKSITLRK